MHLPLKTFKLGSIQLLSGILGVHPPASGLTRRSFTALCGGAAALAASAPARAGSDGLAAFLDLSARLTGFPAKELDAGFADGLLRALAESGRGAGLGGLLQAREDADFRELEAEIIGAWYSGMLPTAAGPVVATLYGALVWAAAWFAAPPGVCAGNGSWSRPPASQESTVQADA